MILPDASFIIYTPGLSGSLLDFSSKLFNLELNIINYRYKKSKSAHFNIGIEKAILRYFWCF